MPRTVCYICLRYNDRFNTIENLVINEESGSFGTWTK